jgi:thiamine pyrophosphokinase
MASHDRILIVAAGDVDAAALARLALSAEAVAVPPKRGPDAHGPDHGAAGRDTGACTAGRPFLVAADGGAAHCLAAGLRPDLVLGDFDSLAEADQERLRVMGVELRVAPRDKDESDMELCLLVALAMRATSIDIVGASGLVRPEHGIANVLLLADPRLDGRRVRLVGRGSRTWRMGTADGPGEARIDGAPGDLLSLLPLDACVKAVQTESLRFPLNAEDLVLGSPRGLSNELLGEHARVTSGQGRLLVVHTDRDAEDAWPAGDPPGISAARLRSAIPAPTED